MGTAESVRTAAVPGRTVGKLLVVDDDPEVRGMLSRLLEVEGYKVTEAVTGAEAIGSLANGRPDLVILDVMLTTEDGFDVLAAILNSNPPVLSESGRERPAELDRLIARCLEKDAARRFSSGRELHTALKDLGRQIAMADSRPQTHDTLIQREPTPER